MGNNKQEPTSKTGKVRALLVGGGFYTRGDIAEKIGMERDNPAHISQISVILSQLQNAATASKTSGPLSITRSVPPEGDTEFGIYRK